MECNLGVLLVGAIFLAAGILIMKNHLNSKKNNTASAMAEVVGYDREVNHDSDHGSSVVYYPILRYQAADRWYEKRDSVGRGRKKYEIRDQVEILYDPQNPENFNIAGDKSTFFIASICICIGLGVCILSFFAK